MLKDSDIYDKKNVYKEEIAPIVRNLMIRCSLNKLPMFLTVAVANSEKGTEYESNVLLAGTQRSLEDNRIGRVLLKLNGIDMENTPEWVKKDVSELEEYLDRVRVDRKEEDYLDVSVTDDRLHMLDDTINGERPLNIKPKKEGKENGSKKKEGAGGGDPGGDDGTPE